MCARACVRVRVCVEYNRQGADQPIDNGHSRDQGISTAYVFEFSNYHNIFRTF